MKRAAVLLLLLMTGCSTAPLADTLDFVKPGRLPPGPRQYYGGVGPPLPPQPGTPTPANPAIPPLPVPSPPDGTGTR